MSSQPPDPYQHPTQPAATQPEILQSGHGSTVRPATRPRSGARKALAAGVSLVVVAGLGVGGYAAWSAFFAIGPQPAEALPASTVGYVSLDLDPAGRQKLEARETLAKFPALDGQIDTDSESGLRASLFERLEDAGACPDIDWEEDVDPWLGDRFAAAAVDLGKRDDESPLGVTPVVVVQVTDVAGADAGLEALLDCATDEMDSGSPEFDDPDDPDSTDDEQPAYGWSVEDGWAVLAESGDLARAVTDAADEAPLSDDDDFRRWTDAAGDHGVLTAYASPDAGPLLAEAASESMGGSSSCAAESFDEGYDGEYEPCDDTGSGSDPAQEAVERYLEDFEGAGLQVRFADGGLEVEAASSTDLLAASGYGVLARSDGGDDVVASLPDDTAAAFGIGFEPGWFEATIDSYSMLTGDMVDLDGLLEEFEDQTGLSLPEDAEALFGDSAAVAVGPGFSTDAEVSDIEVAVKIQGDPDRIAEVLEKLEDTPEAAEELGEILDHDSEGGHVVIGPSSGYREDLLGQGDLGSSDKYEGVVPESGRASTVLYVDVDAFDDLLEDSSDVDPEVIENLQVIAAVGYSTWVEGDVGHAVLKVSTDD